MNVLDRLFTLTRRSGLYQSPAWPDRKDPPFINAVVVSDMKVPPSTVLKALHSTEAAFGRHRERKNAPRTMDLDLLAVDDMIIRPDREEGIYLPHPSMAERDFVLVPLVEVLPDWVHPETGKTALQMRDSLEQINTVSYSAENAAH